MHFYDVLTMEAGQLICNVNGYLKSYQFNKLPCLLFVV